MENYVQAVTSAPVDVVAAHSLDGDVGWRAQNISARATIFWLWADAAPVADDNAGRIGPGEEFDFSFVGGVPAHLWVWTDSADGGRLFLHRRALV